MGEARDHIPYSAVTRVLLQHGAIAITHQRGHGACVNSMVKPKTGNGLPPGGNAARCIPGIMTCILSIFSTFYGEAPAGPV